MKKDIWEIVHQEVLGINDALIQTTSAIPIGNEGLLVKTFSRQRNPDGSYVLSEALCFVPNGAVAEKEGVKRIY